MIYRQYLVMRKALAWFAGVLLAIVLIVLIVTQGGPLKADYDLIATSSGWLAAVFATIFGVALGNGSREAARVLWVLPSERWKLALRVVAVDLAGTTLAFASAYAILLVFFAAARLRSSVELQGVVSGAGIATALAMAYAVYGWSALVGMLGRRVAYSGIVALPALITWAWLARMDGALGTILRAPIAANPIAVFNTWVALSDCRSHCFTYDPVTAALLWLGSSSEALALVAIAVAACGLAAVLWQRAEAISI